MPDSTRCSPQQTKLTDTCRLPAWGARATTASEGSRRGFRIPNRQATVPPTPTLALPLEQTGQRAEVHCRLPFCRYTGPRRRLLLPTRPSRKQAFGRAARRAALQQSGRGHQGLLQPFHSGRVLDVADDYCFDAGVLAGPRNCNHRRAADPDPAPLATRPDTTNGPGRTLLVSWASGHLGAAGHGASQIPQRRQRARPRLGVLELSHRHEAAMNGSLPQRRREQQRSDRWSRRPRVVPGVCALVGDVLACAERQQGLGCWHRLG
jgi:hypothetical protein